MEKPLLLHSKWFHKQENHSEEQEQVFSCAIHGPPAEAEPSVQSLCRGSGKGHFQAEGCCDIGFPGLEDAEVTKCNRWK